MINFFSIFSIFYIVNETNIEEVKEKIKTIPSFGLFYSPYCGHCLRVHPTWLNVTEEFISDPSVIMFECDCSNKNKICSQLRSIHAYPTFVKMYKNKQQEINVKRTFEGIKEVVENLKGINKSLSCSSFPELLENYPAVVINAQDPEAGCKLINEISLQIDPYLSNRLYARKSQNFSVQGYLSEKTIIPFPSQDINVNSIIDFLSEIGLKQYGYFNLSLLLHSKKRAAFVIRERSYFKEEDFNTNSNDINKMFIISMINLEDFKSLYPKIIITKKQLPSFAILNSDKTKFTIIPNPNPDKLFTFMREVAQGKHDELMNVSFKAFTNNIKDDESYHQNAIFELSGNHSELPKLHQREKRFQSYPPLRTKWPRTPHPVKKIQSQTNQAKIILVTSSIFILAFSFVYVLYFIIKEKKIDERMKD